MLQGRPETLSKIYSLYNIEYILVKMHIRPCHSYIQNPSCSEKRSLISLPLYAALLCLSLTIPEHAQHAFS